MQIARTTKDTLDRTAPVAKEDLRKFRVTLLRNAISLLLTARDYSTWFSLNVILLSALCRVKQLRFVTRFLPNDRFILRIAVYWTQRKLYLFVTRLYACSLAPRARTHIHWILIDCNSLFYPNSAIRKREPESHGGASPDLGAAEKPTSTTSHRINYDVNDNNDDDDNDNDNDNCHDADLAIDTADYRGGYPGQPGTSTTATIAAVDRQCVITNGDA